MLRALCDLVGLMVGLLTNSSKFWLPLIALIAYAGVNEGSIGAYPPKALSLG